MRTLPLSTPAFSLLALVLFAILGIATLEARDYDDDFVDRYDDAPWDDRSTNISVSVLTEAGVLEGHPDGTFKAEDNLNRAEFMKIVMKFVPQSSTDVGISYNCFPDVDGSEWFAQPVCRGKAYGYVSGNEREGVPPEQWRFEPARAVQYEEVLKILSKVFAVPLNDSGEGEWYTPYVTAAANLELDIGGLVPGDKVTRGEMARLTAAYLAYSEGELELFRSAERGEMSSSSMSASSLSMSGSLSSMRSSSLSSSRSSSLSSTGSSLSSFSSTGSTLSVSTASSVSSQ